MKRILSLTLALVMLLSLSGVTASAEDTLDISAFELPKPVAPDYFIYTDGDASEGAHDDLRMYMVVDPEVIAVSSEWSENTEAFYEKYGLWYFNIVMQYDVSLDGETNWQYTPEWDTEYYNGGYADGYQYEGIRTDMIEDFEFFWLVYHEGQGSDTFKPYQPAIITDIYHDYGYDREVYSFDTKNHSLYIRCRYYMEWEPLVEYEEGNGPGEKQIAVSDWSESAVFGKNSTQKIPDEPTSYEAPVISDLRIELQDDEEWYCIEFVQDTPDSVWEAYLYYMMNDYFEPLNLDSQVSVNGGEWIDAYVANSEWATKDGERTLVFDGSDDLTPDTNVKLRVRFSGPHGYSAWSNVLEVNGVHAHEWGPAEIITPPTPTTVGQAKLTCECGHIKYQDLYFGDSNGDGYVDNLDASLILKYDAAIIDLNPLQLCICDANGDGYVDNLDATLILKYDAGLVSSFPNASFDLEEYKDLCENYYK
ncbi:MAG: dockerin type I repeat-containing protein [Clostridia bacterium]|nr:dockerin type I repeat-containing protein [Clostridia bacterium]